MFPRSNRFGRAFFCAGIAILTASAVGQTVANKPVLIVGSEQEYPPFSKGMTDDTAGGDLPLNFGTQ